MRVLGLSAGNPDGSAEILLKLALQAAEIEGAEAALVRLHALSLPTRPVAPGEAAAVDDGPWLWDQVMESDGLIVSTPIYSRTIAGTLKLVADRLAGPAADVQLLEGARQVEPLEPRAAQPRLAQAGVRELRLADARAGQVALGQVALLHHRAMPVGPAGEDGLHGARFDAVAVEAALVAQALQRCRGLVGGELHAGTLTPAGPAGQLSL